MDYIAARVFLKEKIIVLKDCIKQKLLLKRHIVVKV